ncbi:methionine--tRNA ligase [Thermasporomyces composti]|jgi:methionyl-tRNA synthetase|uniref:Methionine--tRNA ligase n=1 Tax=Thermasporomyces composti TaxID=696763 RepID=A0A3D9V2J1_THECX|nr:methionine--tRNA ligase [Thermasporomyces composti]REF35747.1 methionyl-tRNA synthetase [Thermasporomyces composti]
MEDAAAKQRPNAGEGKAFYVTTPIYYVNDAPHIGHAYTTVAADVLARWHRQRGESVWFLTGTDEHGQKVMRSAEAKGMRPREWADRLVESAWKPVLDTIEASPDDFIRTTESRHTERVREFWQHLYDAGQVYPGTYEGPYCVSCEEFKIPSELVEGEDGARLCPVHGRPVEMLSETNYFFRLSEYTEKLLDHYEKHPEFIQPESARNEVIAFVKQGLQDLSITRSTFDWGIPVPWDDDHVLYVWIDALLNYVTAAGYRTDPLLFKRLWPADVHLVGKDILRFHAVIWPAMLMAAGLPLPKTVFAHGWLLVGGEKMSKTKLTGIAPSQIVDTFGADALRYYFLRAIQFGSDGSFSWEHLSAVYSSELANGLGNLAARVTAMVGRYFGGVLPAAASVGPAEQAIADKLAETVRVADDAVVGLRFHEALAAIDELVDAVNGYLTEQEPWKVAKDDSPQAQERLATILYTAAEALRGIAVLHHPFMPKATTTLWKQLGAESDLGPIEAQPLTNAGRWGILPPGSVLTKGEPLFPRIEESETS